ncbi:hypothetical protein HPB49_000574 [Dermacentor silvarum]|uniref:Uncharacterized protein n=1 Tax=Dermacentor silvarum TaxID=543639 RepID=A0ACB8C0W0_DERSI|nr:hypothetical protein HPB49_000574 [Dermacentor silvarum]
MSMEVVVEGEIISPEDFKADAGWMESHRQRRAKILEDLNVEARKDNKNRNQDAEQREATRGRPCHRKQTQAPLLPELPKDDIKIILRPKEGLNVSKTSHVSLRDSIFECSRDPRQRRHHRHATHQLLQEHNIYQHARHGTR